MSDLPEPPPPPSRGFPVWPFALGLFVALCFVGLAFQMGSWRPAPKPRERAVRSREAFAPRRMRARHQPTGDLPAFGEYVYVEELPEALTKPAPEYPEEARMAGQEGLVVVQALIGTDGLVKDTRVVKSVPSLDDAAVAAVEQWTFKPALAEGKPVAVWVAVPVKFSLD